MMCQTSQNHCTNRKYKLTMKALLNYDVCLSLYAFEINYTLEKLHRYTLDFHVRLIKTNSHVFSFILQI